MSLMTITDLDQLYLYAEVLAQFHPSFMEAAYSRWPAITVRLSTQRCFVALSCQKCCLPSWPPFSICKLQVHHHMYPSVRFLQS